MFLNTARVAEQVPQFLDLTHGEAKTITISIGQKLAGWPLDFPAADRNRLAAPKTPISIAPSLTVLSSSIPRKGHRM